MEGAVGNEADLEKLRAVRARARVLIALGDCAVTANVPAMRNPLGADLALRLAYLQNADLNGQIPSGVPSLLPQARPIHEYVQVDRYLPGCPPSAQAIWDAIVAALDMNAEEKTVANGFCGGEEKAATNEHE